MTNQQRTVIWLGLFLIALNLIIKWSTIKSVIFNGANLLSKPTTTTTPPAGTKTTPSNVTVA
jgi:hypothetical protein